MWRESNEADDRKRQGEKGGERGVHHNREDEETQAKCVSRSHSHNTRECGPSSTRPTASSNCENSPAVCLKNSCGGIWTTSAHLVQHCLFPMIAHIQHKRTHTPRTAARLLASSICFLCAAACFCLLLFSSESLAALGTVGSAVGVGVARSRTLSPRDGMTCVHAAQLPWDHL